MIIKPINNFLYTINNIKNGDFSIKCEIKNNDEMSKIGEKLNDVSELIKNAQSMCEKVNMSYQDLWQISNETNLSTEAISTILDTITAIADQTSLLALNASIEANSLNLIKESTGEIIEKIRFISQYAERLNEDRLNIVDTIQRISNI